MKIEIGVRADLSPSTLAALEEKLRAVYGTSTELSLTRATEQFDAGALALVADIAATIAATLYVFIEAPRRHSTEPKYDVWFEEVAALLAKLGVNDVEIVDLANYSAGARNEKGVASFRERSSGTIYKAIYTRSGQRVDVEIQSG